MSKEIHIHIHVSLPQSTVEVRPGSIEIAAAPGVSAEEVAAELNIHEKLKHRWARANQAHQKEPLAAPSPKSHLAEVAPEKT